MQELTIAVLVGSLRQASLNQRFAKAVEKMAPEGVTFRFVRIDDLPHFNEDIEHEPLPALERLRADIQSADGVMIITPEYNKSISGVLKNALDWGTRPPGNNVWKGKPAAVVGVSPGKLGTAVAQHHLRSILVNLGMVAMASPQAYLHATPEFFTDDGAIGEDSREFIQGWLDAVLRWVSHNSH